jgi:hypothetical protein
MGTTEERLKEDLQRARAEREEQRTLRTTELAAEKQSRHEAALERHEDTMSQLRTMRELLGEQHESQAQRRAQTEQRHAEEMQWRGDTLRQMSDVKAALASLRDERRAAHEQRAEEHARANAGEYLISILFENDNLRVMCRLRSKKSNELSTRCRGKWQRQESNSSQ